MKSAAAKSLQSCLTLCDPIDGSPPGSAVPGILQARTLEWVAISFSNACNWKVKVKSLSCVWLLPTPRTAAYQALPPMGFSRQEYWSGVPLPSPKWSHDPINRQFYNNLKYVDWIVVPWYYTLYLWLINYFQEYSTYEHTVSSQHICSSDNGGSNHSLRLQNTSKSHWGRFKVLFKLDHEKSVGN